LKHNLKEDGSAVFDIVVGVQMFTNSQFYEFAFPFGFYSSLFQTQAYFFFSFSLAILR
jgi:hypothetical protein